MFESLSEKLSGVFKALRGKGKLGEADIDEAMRQVRMALLEADVHYRVVKQFAADVKARAMGRDVAQSLTPGQTVVKIVRDELQKVLGEHAEELDLRAAPPVTILLAGLQGSGKTTTAGKLAWYLRKHLKRSPYLVPADVQRPAAVAQLKKIAGDLGVPVFDTDPSEDPARICRKACEAARVGGYDTVIVDTAGRLHVDEPLMGELKRIAEATSPREVLFVADAMTGQDAVNVAAEFDRAVGLTGVILTKMDGDARGGAALSLRAVVGKPVKFVGVGEKSDALEPFHPERMVSRILGMGDVLSLIERAEAAAGEADLAAAEKMLAKGDFSLEDFRDQMRMVRRMGGVGQLMGMMPGMGKLKDAKVDEKEVVRAIAIVDSMTPMERRRPDVINAGRRRRIAAGSGTRVEDVNRLLKRFQEARRMMKQMGGLAKMGGKMGGKMGKLLGKGMPKFPFPMG